MIKEGEIVVCVASIIAGTMKKMAKMAYTALSHNREALMRERGWTR